MKEEYKRIELIDKYIKGKLKDNELRSFLKKVKSDKLFAMEVKGIQISISAIKLYGRKSLKEELIQLHNNLTKPSSHKKRSISKKYLKLIESIYIKFFRPYDDIVTVRSSGNDTLSIAMQEYSSQNYLTAIKHFKMILKNKPKDSTALFYCGISLLETNKLKDAKFKFRKLIKLSDEVFKEQAEWYLGLAYLKNYEVEEAIKIFDNIGKESDTYKNARKIVTNLRKANN